MESNMNKVSENKGMFTKGEIRRLGLRSLFMQTSFNYERMQGMGWMIMLLPYLKRIYKDDKEGLARAMKDNLNFLNTNLHASAFLAGLMISFEEKKEDRDMINNLRVALFGPASGIGDAIFWFTIIPILAGICSSFAINGSILGPVIFAVVDIGFYFLRQYWAQIGYNLGVKSISLISENSVKVAKAATILGMTVIGGLVASYVSIKTIVKIAVTKTSTISLQKDLLDKIFPNLLPLGYVFLMYYLLKYKKVKAPILIAITFVVTIILSYFKIL